MNTTTTVQYQQHTEFRHVDAPSWAWEDIGDGLGWYDEPYTPLSDPDARAAWDDYICELYEAIEDEVTYRIVTYLWDGYRDRDPVEIDAIEIDPYLYN